MGLHAKKLDVIQFQNLLLQNYSRKNSQFFLKFPTSKKQRFLRK